MKKQTKGTRTPPRRKPLPKAKPQRISQGNLTITQDTLDNASAVMRAMKERMPPAILEEYLRIGQIQRDTSFQPVALSAEDDARMDEITKEYYHPPPQEVLERHLADIAKERAQAAEQDQQSKEADP